ncbi:iron chelate uptake ABC transporter family permease subunit [Microbacterium sp. lyk4-40-TSB-66]|uniref:iron chelate uptake ABC transporter family permease subunit n=1 Tax=Microbacterium sp. lyk4-40-TSB-66 TaxID=3040294 RepID=UPI002549DDF5|nr:iron chelate uptake ABC transporter family permease subunit [Microbacterium sp. lyk4-40-TSB-66]
MADTLTRTTPAVTPRRPRIALRFGLLILIVAVAAVGVLTWNVPGEPGSRAFWLAVNLRVVSLATIALVACCQAVATVLFHTATANRILTPSIMGFDALYVVMQTALVFFFGSAALSATDGLVKVVVQSVLMVGFATLLYGWLFAGRRGNLHIMLLVGVVLGVGFGSLSTVMQRLLTPSDFDILSARLFGNLSNSDAEYLPWGTLVVAVVLVVVWRARHRLDVLALGREASVNLGLAYRREVIVMLVLVAVLISVSTTMVGPMTFFGFLVATLAYQLAGSAQHRVVLPFAVLLGMATLLGGYFVLRHVFYAAGMLSIIIEFVGGVFFLVYLLRKGSL